MSRDASDTIFIGNLPGDVREKELDSLFSKYGRINKVDVKSGRGGAAFGFVQFSDSRDADDAVRGRDGYDFDGKRIRVELTRGSGPRGPGGRPVRDGYDRGYDRRDDGYGRRQSHGPPRRSENRAIIEGLPPTGSWQDIKDHLKSAGDICYADVGRNGDGIVEFEKHEDMKYAIKKFDDTKFTSHKGETAYIRIKEDKGNSNFVSRPPRDNRRGGGRRSRSRSRSRSPIARRRSPSRSRSRSSSRGSRKSRSRSPSKSPVKASAGRSRSNSAGSSPRRGRSPNRRRSPVPDEPRPTSGSPGRSRSGSPAGSRGGSRSRSRSPASNASSPRR